MMTVTAAMVNELRKLTGEGMMDCKKALEAAGGDMEAAIEAMRKRGQAKALNKAGRVAAEGVIVVNTARDHKTAAMIEVNCETDFVARGDEFKQFAEQVVAAVLTGNIETLDALLLAPLKTGESLTVEQARQELVGKIGENIQIRRIALLHALQGMVASYVHGGRIGVLVSLNKADPELGKDIAMHIAASHPLVLTPEQVSPDLIAKEKEIFTAQAVASGKSPEIAEKMVGGRIQKFVSEISLLAQPFVKTPDMTVGQLLDNAHAKVERFVRYGLGEGIEKKVENFTEEVMTQVRTAGS